VQRPVIAPVPARSLAGRKSIQNCCSLIVRSKLVWMPRRRRRRRRRLRNSR
jgi:hypothetical protein